MKKIVRLTESDLIRIVKKVIKEQNQVTTVTTTAPTSTCDNTFEELSDKVNTVKFFDFKKTTTGEYQISTSGFCTSDLIFKGNPVQKNKIKFQEKYIDGYRMLKFSDLEERNYFSVRKNTQIKKEYFKFEIGKKKTPLTFVVDYYVRKQGNEIRFISVWWDSKTIRLRDLENLKSQNIETASGGETFNSAFNKLMTTLNSKNIKDNEDKILERLSEIFKNYYHK